ncbi:AAA family ATPase [Methylorubrum populi]
MFIVLGGHLDRALRLGTHRNRFRGTGADESTTAHKVAGDPYRSFFQRAGMIALLSDGRIDHTSLSLNEPRPRPRRRSDGSFYESIPLRKLEDDGAFFAEMLVSIRFDMSEFSAEHSDQRLIGAPPGYVGYDVGGELTNAIRERPFSVVLFDEIEKAHPRILDKFLQVLDDGVLTSGRGDRVYFSEAFIIFTSNLGIYRLEADGSRVANVTAEDAFFDVQSKVRAEIDRHFKLVLNRPEILNRIGENILVFDFIRPDIAELIFEGQVDDVLRGIASDQGIAVTITDDARAALRQACLSDLSNGGRGIRNKVESGLISPLARALFDRDAAPGDAFSVTTLHVHPEGGTVIELTRSGMPS